MSIIAWIAVGLAAGLLANILLPGKRSRSPIFGCLICFTEILGGSWAASQFRLNGFFSFSAWLAAIAEAAVLLLVFGSAPISAGCLSCRLVRQW
jgi:uncharacterized membrane protein YeaQ/YmgE (transglycosylase-associated protein family)